MKKVVWGCAILMVLIHLMHGIGLAQSNPFQQTGPTTCEIGCTGPAGKDGKDGINGTNGTNGVDGRNGIDGINGRDGRDGRDLTIEPLIETPLVHWDGRIPAGFHLMGSVVNETNLNDWLYYNSSTGEIVRIYHYGDSLWWMVRPPTEGELLHPGGGPRKVWKHIISGVKSRRGKQVLYAEDADGQFCIIPWGFYPMFQVF